MQGEADKQEHGTKDTPFIEHMISTREQTQEQPAKTPQKPKHR